MREAKQNKNAAPPPETLGIKKPVVARINRYCTSSRSYATIVQKPTRRSPLEQAIGMADQLKVKEWVHLLLHAPAALWDHDVFNGFFKGQKDKHQKSTGTPGSTMRGYFERLNLQSDLKYSITATTEPVATLSPASTASPGSTPVTMVRRSMMTQPRFTDNTKQRKLVELAACENAFRKRATDLGMVEQEVNANIQQARLKRHRKHKLLQKIYDVNQELSS